MTYFKTNKDSEKNIVLINRVSMWLILIGGILGIIFGNPTLFIILVYVYLFIVGSWAIIFGQIYLMPFLVIIRVQSLNTYNNFVVYGLKAKILGIVFVLVSLFIFLIY